MKRRHFLQSSMAAVPFMTMHSTGNLTKKHTMEQPRVINAGVGGNNTQDLLDRIQKDCLAHRPDLTVLMVGTNDMNTKKHIPLPQYTANLDSLSQQIRQAGSELVLMTILPVYEPYLY